MANVNQKDKLAARKALAQPNFLEDAQVKPKPKRKKKK